MQKGVEEGDIDRFYQSNSPSMSLWKGVPPVSYLARNSSREQLEQSLNNFGKKRLNRGGAQQNKNMDALRQFTQKLIEKEEMQKKKTQKRQAGESLKIQVILLFANETSQSTQESTLTKVRYGGGTAKPKSRQKNFTLDNSQRSHSIGGESLSKLKKTSSALSNKSFKLPSYATCLSASIRPKTF